MTAGNINTDLLADILTASLKMAETRVLSPLLDYAMQEAGRLVKAKRGYLVLLSPDGTLDFRVKYAPDDETETEPEKQISTSILYKVIETQEPRLIKDAVNDPNFSSSVSVKALQLRSVMCVPLISRGLTLGVLYVENRQEVGLFTPSDMATLSFFANQAAVCIENAMLNDDLEAAVEKRTAELRNALTHLEKSWGEAVEFNHIRTTWLTNLTHDMRAPLSVALGALSLLAEDIDTFKGEEQQLIGSSLSALQYLNQLIENMFGLTQVEQGKLQLSRKPIKLPEFLGSVCRIAQQLPWHEGVELICEIPDDLPTINFDPTRIQQVLMNLLANALKFTHSGSVKIFAVEETSGVRIGVADTGDGIPDDKQAYIFDRFYQVQNKQSGSGLGLAISKELIEKHGGTIWVESTLGKGSTFQFTLPK